MPLAVPSVLVTNTRSGGGADTVQTTSSISPTGDALLVVAIGARRGGSNNVTVSSITDTLTGTGTWAWAEVNTQVSGTCVQVIAYAKAGSSPGSGTITITLSHGCNRWAIITSEVTGQDVSTPVAQSATNTNTSTTLTCTLGSSPASDSMVFGGVNSISDSAITPGSGFTELQELDSTDTDNAFVQTQYDIDGADTTCDWSDLNTQANAGVAIEIAAEPSAGGLVGIPITHPSRNPILRL